MDFEKKAEDIWQKAVESKRLFWEKEASKIIEAFEILLKTLKKGKKILIFGNGGSAADAQHMAGELINRFRFDRSPLPAIALTTDTSVLTSIANDYSFEEVFTKQIEALGEEGDLALGISTSGNSPNVLKALDLARRKGLYTLGLSGGTGGKMSEFCDLLILVPSDETPRIQEGHIFFIHLICELLEEALFGTS